MIQQRGKIGKEGVVVIPAALRARFGMREGCPVVVEEREEGVLIRPAASLPTEQYTPERKAEFLLNNAVDEEDYERALELVKEMGVDPRTIPHV